MVEEDVFLLRWGIRENGRIARYLRIYHLIWLTFLLVYGVLLMAWIHLSNEYYCILFTPLISQLS